MKVLAALVGIALVTAPAKAAGDFFSLGLNDAADRIFRAVGCTLPEDDGSLIKCSNQVDNGIPETTGVNVWGQGKRERSTTASPSTVQYVFMDWHDYSDGPFYRPHAEQHQAAEMLGRVLLTVGVLHDNSVVRAFFAEIGPDQDKIVSFDEDGLVVFVEVARSATETHRAVFIGPHGFKMPGP